MATFYVFSNSRIIFFVVYMKIMAILILLGVTGYNSPFFFVVFSCIS